MYLVKCLFSLPLILLLYSCSSTSKSSGPGVEPDTSSAILVRGQGGPSEDSIHEDNNAAHQSMDSISTRNDFPISNSIAMKTGTVIMLPEKLSLYALEANVEIPKWAGAASEDVDKIRDDDLHTAWICDMGDKPCAIGLAFPEPAKVCAVRLYPTIDAKTSRQTKRIKIYTDVGSGEFTFKRRRDYQYAFFTPCITTTKLVLEVKQLVDDKNRNPQKLRRAYLAELDALGTLGIARPPLAIDPKRTVTTSDGSFWQDAEKHNFSGEDALPAWIETIDGKNSSKRLLRGHQVWKSAKGGYCLVRRLRHIGCYCGSHHIHHRFTLIDLKRRVFYGLGMGWSKELDGLFRLYSHTEKEGFWLLGSLLDGSGDVESSIFFDGLGVQKITNIGTVLTERSKYSKEMEKRGFRQCDHDNFYKRSHVGNSCEQITKTEGIKILTDPAFEKLLSTMTKEYLTSFLLCGIRDGMSMFVASMEYLENDEPPIIWAILDSDKRIRTKGTRYAFPTVPWLRKLCNGVTLLDTGGGIHRIMKDGSLKHMYYASFDVPPPMSCLTPND